MGILPLQFLPNETPRVSAHRQGSVRESQHSRRAHEGFPRGKELVVKATRPRLDAQFTVTVRIDTPQELQYYRHRGSSKVRTAGPAGAAREALTCFSFV